MPVLGFGWLRTARHDISAVLFHRDNVAIYNWQMKYAHNTVSPSTDDTYNYAQAWHTYAKPTEMTRTSTVVLVFIPPTNSKKKIDCQISRRIETQGKGESTLIFKLFGTVQCG